MASEAADAGMRSPERPGSRADGQDPTTINAATCTTTTTGTGTGTTGTTAATSPTTGGRAPPPPSSASSTGSASPTTSKKRTASQSEPGGGGGGGGAPKATKRRAARACISCRARKVRCDVVEGAPCGNCRWDNVECIVQESRRRKKNVYDAGASASGGHGQQHHHPHGGGRAGAVEALANLKAKAASNPVPISTAADIRPVTTTTTPAIEAHPGATVNHHGGVGVGIGDAIVPAASTAAAVAAAVAVAPGGVHQHQQQQQQQPAFLDMGGLEGHVGGLIYQTPSGLRPDSLLLANLQPPIEPTGGGGNPYSGLQCHWRSNHAAPGAPSSQTAVDDAKTAQFLNSLEEPDASSQLPAFIRPLPAKITPEDVDYLHLKGALTLPGPSLQNALLHAYVEYVHPYMPLMELHDFLSALNSLDGLYGQISLLLYHAVMFAGTAYVDAKHLKDAGYANRKAARKVFFQKTRLLYDFDYECDRLVLVQALLLMTYWYETPDDQKDTWHWMGVAISLAHTIGLHRNPATTNMSPRKQKLWKRIWWSCLMRDRLIALGMRRPTRIKDEDYDVPPLEEGDFEIGPLADEVQVVNHDCTLVRDVLMQQELALMCIAKAKLCLCIGKVLAAQYSVLVRDKSRPENTTNSTMMLHPKKQLDNIETVGSCDAALTRWAENLPPCCQYRPLKNTDVNRGRDTLAVQRNLLHMVYCTTVSALHRPQFLHTMPQQAPTPSRKSQELSRLKVRDAADNITRMGSELYLYHLERFLPTTGVTVVLPAMIIHLLEMKSQNPDARNKAVQGFRRCMRVMEKLRDIYAAADYAVAFLDAALRKAAIDMRAQTAASDEAAKASRRQFHAPTATPVTEEMTTPPPDNSGPYMTPSGANILNMFVVPPPPPPTTMTTTTAGAEFVGHHSPPHTDKDGRTPSASGSCSDAPPGPLDVDMDFNGDGQDEFDWNALTGTNIDFDQWLQFPGDVSVTTKTGEAGSGGAADPSSFLNMLGDGGTQQAVH